MDMTSDITTMLANDSFHRAFDVGLNHERKRLGNTHPLFINGRPCRSTQETFPKTSPSDHRLLLGKFQRARQDHVDKAVQAARNAFPFWRELGWEQRVGYLRKLGDLMEHHQFELSALVTLEAGKTRGESTSEVAQAIGLIRYYCQQMESRGGYRLATNGAGSERSFDSLEPYGVWAVVTPFDSPLASSVCMLACALLAGNTAVFKPSSQTPLIGLRLYDLFPQAGFPIGVVNYLTGPGSEVGVRLANHSGINGFIFAGSRPVGLSLRHQVLREEFKPCILELGANNPAIVMPSANLDDAAEGVCRSAFAEGGQTSSSWSRVYVHRSVSKEFTELLVEKARACTVGLPEDRETVMGPLISDEAVQSFRKAVALGRKDGHLLCGGQLKEQDAFAFGHFVEPTVFDQVRRDSQLFQEEFLVPVLAMTEVKSLDEAINLANTGPYGFSAGIYTQVDAEQEQFFEQIEAGSAYCNRRAGATSGFRLGTQSLGGWKGSGSTGLNMFGPYYLTQFMREQSRTVCW